MKPDVAWEMFRRISWAKGSMVPFWREQPENFQSIWEEFIKRILPVHKPTNLCLKCRKNPRRKRDPFCRDCAFSWAVERRKGILRLHESGMKRAQLAEFLGVTVGRVGQMIDRAKREEKRTAVLSSPHEGPTAPPASKLVPKAHPEA